MNPYRLLAIDETKKPAHSFLRETDFCLYLMEYFARMGYTHSHENDFMQNLKKPVDRKGLYEYKYKLKAIKEATDLFRNSVVPVLDLWGPCTIVPIPCSKAKSDPLYDDRVEKFSSECLSGQNHNFKELIQLRQSRISTHENPEARLRPEEHMNLLQIDTSSDAQLADHIILVDDMITTGAQFVACKDLILQTYPNKTITGIFLARRSITPTQDIFKGI